MTNQLNHSSAMFLLFALLWFLFARRTSALSARVSFLLSFLLQTVVKSVLIFWNTSLKSLVAQVMMGLMISKEMRGVTRVAMIEWRVKWVKWRKTVWCWEMHRLKILHIMWSVIRREIFVRLRTAMKLLRDRIESRKIDRGRKSWKSICHLHSRMELNWFIRIGVFFCLGGICRCVRVEREVRPWVYLIIFSFGMFVILYCLFVVSVFLYPLFRLLYFFLLAISLLISPS